MVGGMQQIADWLKKLGMSEYAQVFADNDIDFSVLRHLTDQHLKDLGVSLGHRLKMLHAISELENASLAANQPSIGTKPVSHDIAERRQLTVMFCDLVGSTALSARLDPEELREIIGAYHRCCTDLVERNGGFVAKYMGDGVLAYFGYPEAHEDDPERAVRAGFTLIDAIGALKATQRLKVRIGIATGLVVVGDLIGAGSAQEQAAVGETPNLAARLQALAEPGSIVVADNTRRQIGALFELVDLGPQQFKGFAEAQRAWRVIGENRALGRFEALRMSTAPLVGREEELELLLRRWAQSKVEGERVVVLSAEAGIGKSRLAEALRERIADEPHTRLQYYCSPHHQDSALHPIVMQLERAAGFVRNDEPRGRLRKLEVLLAHSSATREEIALIADMLSVPTDGRYALPEMTAQQRKQKTLQALLGQVERLAVVQPVLMIVEDLQWIDPTSLEWLMLVAEHRTLRALLLITARPEGAPSWPAYAHVTTLVLSRLNARDAAIVVERIAGERALPPETVREVVARSDGVPLFVEELAKAVVEAEAPSAPLSLSAVPPTLHASLMARLDRLGPIAKDIAQKGAAIGRQFGYELLALIGERPETELRDGLERLTRAGLLFARGSPPDATYTFKHALVQDAAYGTLLRSRRQDLHARIAMEIENHFAEMGQQRPELLAHHATQAGLIERAVVQWGKAGRKSVARSAMAEAVSQLRRGLELVPALPDTPERQRLELELQSALGGALVASIGIAAPETGSAYARARALCEQLGDSVSLIPVLSGQISHHFGRAEYALAQRTAEDLLRLAQSRGDTASELVGSRSMGLNLHLLGEFRAAARNFERVLQLYDPNEHGALTAVAAYDMRALALTYLSVDLFILGHTDEALSRGEEAIAWSRQLNHPHTLGYVLSFSAFVHMFRRENEKAEAMTEEVLALAAVQNLPVWLPSANVFRGYLRVARGDTEALAFARQGIAAKKAQGSVLNQPFFLSLLAASCERAGKAEEALSLLAEAFAIAERTGERWFEAELYRLRGDWLLVHCSGMEAEAETCLHRALALARQQAAIMWELRATVSLARFWSGRGRLREAGDLLVPLCDALARSRPIPDIEAARALLIELR
jgi:class 3 adenylate cyclase/predicted ATPase